MANMAPAARDIPTATSDRDNLTAVAARSVPVTRPHHPIPLPTPPNSISPALPPHGLKAQLQKARLEPIDSDLDLQDDHCHDRDHYRTIPGLLQQAGNHPAGVPAAATIGSPPYDAAGAITPAMLAKFHLPQILLDYGPLAIRHIMGYLTTSVPGFAGIPPAKARRLVVGALEGRGSGGEGGGVDGDVEFEKVGWGRWDARRRGQPPRTLSTSAGLRGGSPNSDAYATSAPSGIPISSLRPGVAGAAWMARPGANNGASGSSVGDHDSTMAFSHDDHDITMLENEADKMSMDGSASASCSEAPDDDMVMKTDDPEDMTDDEDWAAVGAVALRARSYQAQSLANNQPFSSHGGNVYSSAGGTRSGMRSTSAGMMRAPQLGNNFDFSASALGVTSDAQEREAVEALLRLGSV